MEKFNLNEWLATSPIASFLRVFLALVVSQAVADFVQVGSFDFSNFEHWIITAVAAAIPGLLRWINPSDPAFGNSKAG
jgi:hypothetical protein